MIEKCVITGEKLDNRFKIIHDPDFNGIKYFFEPVGYVFVTDYAMTRIKCDSSIAHKIGGLTRCSYELKESTPIIDTELLALLNRLETIPRTFIEKYNHFLSILFKTGGNEYKTRTIEVERDYFLAFAEDINELQRIIDLAIKSGDLECKKAFSSEEIGTFMYLDLGFTYKGLEKINKTLNNIFSFFQLRIDTGSSDIDRKINHAYSLFTHENSTIEDKRSACEELSFVLEPIREDLSKFFTKKDVNHFFDLVNNFDIRHNKETTRKLEYVEQVEWIFFGLLNTILTYGKLKKNL